VLRSLINPGFAPQPFRCGNQALVEKMQLLSGRRCHHFYILDFGHFSSQTGVAD
jgi:hypothetical protein